MVTVNDVTNRLSQLGYEVQPSELSYVQFELDLILDYVVNYCNFPSVNDIPEILDRRIIDRVCSEYLYKKKNSGQLEGFDYSNLVKTIKEGDTQIQFGTSSDGETPESRFDNLVDYLQRGFDKWISLHRRLRW